MCIARTNLHGPSRLLHRAWLLWLLLGPTTLVDAQSAASPAHHLGLQEATQRALLNNRSLQIERINPEIARSTLLASRGFYDPLLTGGLRWADDTTPAELDPTTGLDTPARKTSTDNATLGVTGFLPSGLSYSFLGGYNYQSGTRDLAQQFESYNVDAGIFLQQPLLKNFWIDQPRFTIRVSRGNLQISELGVQFVASSVVNLTRQAYYELVYAWEALRVRQELLHTRERFLDGIQRQIDLGSLTVLEQKLAQSQLSRVQTALITSSNLLDLTANNLRTLMGTTATNWTEDLLVPTGSLAVLAETFELQPSWQRALTNRADLQQLRTQAGNAELAVKFRRNQLFPALDVVGSYGRQGVSLSQPFPPIPPDASSSEAFAQLRNGDAPASMIGVVFSIPLGLRAERGEYRASRQLEQQARLLVQQQEEQVLREISDAVFNARSSLERTRSARRSVIFAEQALEAEEQKLRGGASNIYVVLQLQEDLATARLDELLAKRDYHQAVSQLQFAEGSILEEARLSLEFD